MSAVAAQMRLKMSSSLSWSIVWFRSDLRVLDNPVLVEASAASSGRVIPVYCFDPRQFGRTPVGGFPKSNIHRTRFLLESVQELKFRLEKLGASLLIRQGKPEVVIPKLAEEFKATAVYHSKEVCAEEVHAETKLKQNLSERNIKCVSLWGACTLYHLDDLPVCASKLPSVFTKFRKVVEASVAIRPVVDAPSVLSPLPAHIDLGAVPALKDLLPEYNDQVVKPFDKRAVLQFHGGESAALARLKYYVWDTNLIATYKDTRNGLVGGDYSSKLSPWLAHGCISARYVYHHIKQYEACKGANESTYWLCFELLWRDYFRFAALRYGSSLFQLAGPRKRTDLVWKTDMRWFEAWKNGMTGFPFVDANMRELNSTGFMSNRGRQNVASFLARDLHLDWRLGAEWFESLLLDYDPCSNYGNWTYAAGVGDDPRQNRHFNVVRQAKTYDQRGLYAKLWIPELGDLPPESVYEPYKVSWRSHKLSQYPPPIIARLGNGLNITGHISKGRVHNRLPRVRRGSSH